MTSLEPLDHGRIDDRYRESARKLMQKLHCKSLSDESSKIRPRSFPSLSVSDAMHVQSVIYCFWRSVKRVDLIQVHHFRWHWNYCCRSMSSQLRYLCWEYYVQSGLERHFAMHPGYRFERNRIVFLRWMNWWRWIPKDEVSSAIERDVQDRPWNLDQKIKEDLEGERFEDNVGSHLYHLQFRNWDMSCDLGQSCFRLCIRELRIVHHASVDSQDIDTTF